MNKGLILLSIEKVRDYFKKFGIEDRIIEFSTSSATVELAAQAVGCAPARIAKTLSFKLPEGSVLIVAAGDAKVDNAKYKHFFGVKAKMLAPEEVEPCIGHAIGGVCPFAVNASVKVYLDISLKRFATFFPACGSHNSAIELSPAELENYAANCQGWADLCKDWQDL
ncbi:MAG: YbaK/EbsC family protein [Acidaminococcaceae bacterium]|nr:YbaK/EbsC family protein [Acidaminococcaceae bacterium]